MRWLEWHKENKCATADKGKRLEEFKLRLEAIQARAEYEVAQKQMQGQQHHGAGIPPPGSDARRIPTGHYPHDQGTIIAPHSSAGFGDLFATQRAYF